MPETTVTLRAAYTEHLLGVLSQVSAELEAGAKEDRLMVLLRLRTDTCEALKQTQAGKQDPAQPWGGCR